MSDIKEYKDCQYEDNQTNSLPASRVKYNCIPDSKYPQPKPRSKPAVTPPRNITNESSSGSAISLLPPQDNSVLPAPRLKENSAQLRPNRVIHTQPSPQPRLKQAEAPPKPKIRHRLRSQSTKSSLDITDDEIYENVDRYKDSFSPGLSLFQSSGNPLQSGPKQRKFISQSSVLFRDSLDEEDYSYSDKTLGHLEVTPPPKITTTPSHNVSILNPKPSNILPQPRPQPRLKPVETPSTSANLPTAKILQRLGSKTSLDTTNEEIYENVDRYKDSLNPEPSLFELFGNPPQPIDKEVYNSLNKSFGHLEMLTPPPVLASVDPPKPSVKDKNTSLLDASFLESYNNEVNEYEEIDFEPLAPELSFTFTDNGYLPPSKVPSPDISLETDFENQIYYEEIRLPSPDVLSSEKSRQNSMEESIYDTVPLQHLPKKFPGDEEIEEAFGRNASFRSSADVVETFQPSSRLAKISNLLNLWPNDLHEVDQLSQVNAFLISPINTNVGQHTMKKFLVQNYKGETLWSAQEGFKPFVSICDPLKQEKICLERRRACSSFICPCLLERMRVYAPPGTLIGTIQQKWTFLIPTFMIQDTNDNPLLKLEASFLQLLGCDNKAEFKIMKLDSEIIGHITKHWEIHKPKVDSVTEEPDVYIRAPNNLDSKQKILLLASWFLINSIYFED